MRLLTQIIGVREAMKAGLLSYGTGIALIEALTNLAANHYRLTEVNRL